MKQTIEGKIPIFVIGYPKSGNTWLTRLIGNSLNSPTGSGYLRHSSEIASGGWERPGKYFILKSHHSKYDHPPYIRVSGTPRDRSIIFYIVRNFRDILISSFFHFHRNFDESKILLSENNKEKITFKRIYFNNQITRMTKQWCGPQSLILKQLTKSVIRNALLRLRGKTPPSPVLIGNWSEHVKYWTGLSNKIITIKYEDVLHDPFATLTLNFSALGLIYEPKRVNEAIERQSFNKMKKLFHEKHDKKNMVFMRKGVSGDWKRFLTPSQVNFILKTHGNVLKDLGYI